MEPLDRDSKTIGRSVYTQVYKESLEFWKQSEYTMIKSLRTSTPRLFERSNDTVKEINELSSETGPDNCTIIVFPRSGSPPSVTQVSVKKLSGRVRDFDQIPRFVSCTPISRTMTMRSDVAPFLPFADSKNFPICAFLQELQWTPRFSFDPEIESLEYEVARQLCFNHGFTNDEIDKMELFHRDRDEVWKDNSSFLRLRKENKSGLLWEHNQRDHSTTWPRLKSEDEEHFPISYLDYIPEQVNDVFSNVNRGTYQFCPNLNCLLHFCGVHLRESGVPPFDPVRPNRRSWLKNLNLALERRPDCGPCCYRLVCNQDQWQENIPPCNKQEIALIEGILKFEPDICPCDLAVICRISCKAAYHHCLQKFSGFEFMLMPETNSEEEVETAVIPKPCCYYSPDDPSIYRRNIEHQFCTCADEETCERSPNCLCKYHGRFCERNCRCKKTCGLRFPGCECQQGCRSNGTCLCLEYNRECDPELCIKCNARGDENRRLEKGKRVQCQNVRIMTGIPALLEIKRTQYGAGAFATEGIRREQYIGEYVGELLLANFQSKMKICDYRGLSYLFSFDCDEEICLDADCMGNETRYLNHDEDPNCEVFERSVNGELRLGVQATKTIKSSEELFLDYGEEYWRGHGQ